MKLSMKFVSRDIKNAGILLVLTLCVFLTGVHTTYASFGGLSDIAITAPNQITATFVHPLASYDASTYTNLGLGLLGRNITDVAATTSNSITLNFDGPPVPPNTTGTIDIGTVDWADGPGGFSGVTGYAVQDAQIPSLGAITLQDLDNSGGLSSGDTLSFRFNEPMRQDVTTGNVDSYFGLSNGHSFGTAGGGLSLSWNTSSTTLTVTVGSDAALAPGDVVTPSASFADISDNAITNGPASLDIPFVKITPRTLYFYSTSTYADWNDVTNWWNDSVHTIQASSTPNEYDDVVLDSTVAPFIDDIYAHSVVFSSSTLADPLNTPMNFFYGYINAPAGIVVNSGWNILGYFIGDVVFNDTSAAGLPFYNNSNFASFYSGSDIVGNVRFNGPDNANYGTIYGNAVFRGAYGNAGLIYGNTEFRDGTSNPGTIFGHVTFRDFSNGNNTIHGDADVYAPAQNPMPGHIDGTITYHSYGFDGGSGTPADPFLISSCTLLQSMKDDPTASYRLSGDIDCSDTVNWNAGKGFEPVGTSTSPFTGTFDGNNYTISNLTILRADDTYGQVVDDEQYVGIIGYASSSTISNLNVTNSKIKGWEYVGGIVGYAEQSTISNVSFNQGLESDDCNPGYCVWARYGLYGGGIVGYATSTTISNAVVGASVKGSGNIIGGIVGEMHSTNISYATSTARIDGGTNIGGIAGSANDSTISHVFATGLVDVRYDDGKIGNNGGGIVGYSSYSTTTDAVATGEVQGNSNLGGIVGLSEYSSFTFSTSTGSISSILYGGAVGGFAGSTYVSTFSTSSASGLVSGPSQIGGFVGSSQCQSLYTNDSAYGLVQITDQIGGGFAGSNWCQGTGSTFIRSSATGNVQGGGSATYLGGFIGVAIYTTISESSAAGDITGAIDDVGGFVGYAEANQSIDEYQGPISKSYSTGSVTATGDYIGGFAGFISSGVKISDSYSRGSVEGNNNVGGFVGANSAIARFERSYATGHATGTGENIAGFSGLFPYSETMFSNNYWDGETSGFSDDSNVSGFTVYATSTLAMKNQFTFINSGWDFASIWGQDDAVNDGYPYLYYQSTTAIAPIISAVSTIPSRVHAADAHYDFTVSEACNIQATLLSVSPASEAEVLVTDTTNPSGIKSATVTGMRVGSTYSFSFSCINRSGNVSNSLSVGPFTVVADSEPLTVTPVYNAGPTFGGSTSEWISSFSKTSTPNIPFVKEKATSTATTTPKIFTRDLYVGSVGPDVKALQQYLNAKGFLIAKSGPGSVGKETTRFGFGTRTALIKFQKANKILPATGTFGPRTRGFVGLN